MTDVHPDAARPPRRHLLLVPALALVAIAGCRETPPAPDVVRPVRTMRVADAEGVAGRTYPGIAKAVQEANLSFRVAGPLVSFPVNVGDEVAAGSLLAQIDPRDFEVNLRNVRAQLTEAQASLTLAEDELGRGQEAHDRGVVTEMELSRLREARNGAASQVDSLEAAVDAASDALSYTQLKTPFDGQVVAKYVENFEDVRARQPIVRVLDDSRIEMIIDVPEKAVSLAPYVRDIVCTFDAFPGVELSAEIKEVGTEASRTTRTYPITLIMDQPADVRILPGMTGEGRARRVDLPGGDGGTPHIIPYSAVASMEGTTSWVWLLDETSMTVHKTDVRLGELSALGLHVGGLEPGQVVVTAGVNYLAEGQKVRRLEPAEERVVSIASVSVERRTVTTFATTILVLAGLAAFGGLGQLEDPEFTVKTAAISTLYPGATAAEVELEVTDRLELAVQEMTQVREIESFSRAGMSVVKVYIRPEYTSAKLPQVWDELRKKVSDASEQLPPGAGTPAVGDDFGDVYGFLMAVVGDGFTYAELKTYVDEIKKELSLVTGAARVELWGDQAECIYVEATQARLAQLGLTMEDLEFTLHRQNLVVDGGGLDVQDQRLRIETTGEFTSPVDIEDLVIRRQSIVETEDSQRLIRIRDIADVRRGYREPTTWEMRYGGKPCLGVSISNIAGVNIVDLGRALDARLAEMMADLPIGIEVHRISWQGDLVDESIDDFIVSLAQAVGIVLIVLWVAMGLRTALVVGLTGLVFTILGSFLFMSVFGIDLQRMSLGALIIAMGMMVDNAIVVADGILVRTEQGMDRKKAAVEAAALPSMPLLGATVIAVMAFYPVASSDESAGEYCATLFSVVGISLMLSWVLAVTIAPVMCMGMLPRPKGTGADPYGGRLYVLFRSTLKLAMRLRWIVVLALVAALIGCGALFRYIPQLFFPASARPQFMVDYWAPEGTRIQQVSADLRPLEEIMLADERVTAVSTFIGQGPPRFYLPVDPESPYQSYGQLIVNVNDYRDVDDLMGMVRAHADTDVPEALVVARKYGLGPSETWPVQARISGPAVADPAVLRRLGEEVAVVMRQSPHAAVVRTNWRQKTKKVVAHFNDANARWTGIARQQIADATKRGYDGQNVGLYREDDKLLPILLRHVDSERAQLATSLPALQVRPPFSTVSVPLAQVTDSIDVEWEDPLIWRWDRRRQITVQGVPADLASTLRDDVVEAVEAVPLPPGYDLVWDGEYLSSKDASASLVPGVLPAVVIMALIIVGLFNAYRPPLIIVCIIPFAMIGVTLGLLATGQPFGFVALLGAMSLAGMMTKNAIVLLDQINIERAAGRSPYDAVVESAVSRLRPVMLAAGTTVLGVIPLLGDVFWIAMAVVIMAGLSLGSFLTVYGVPVLYACFYRLEPDA